MTTTHHGRRRREARPRTPINLVSAAILFTVVVTLLVLMISIAEGKTSPLWVLPPVALGFWAILTLRE